jgi:hypothetical protein
MAPTYYFPIDHNEQKRMFLHMKMVIEILWKMTHFVEWNIGLDIQFPTTLVLEWHLQSALP